MSNTAIRNSGREKIQQVLASVGSQKTDDDDKMEAVEHNWHQPNYFSSGQLEELERFTEKAAQSCARKFTQLYHNDFDVAVISTTQHFADEFITGNDARNDYYLAFGAEGRAFGLIGVPTQTAITLVTQLLGDTKSAENSDRDLSQLERSLLFDIASGAVGGLSASYGHCDLQPVGEIVNDRIPVKLKGTEELCKITFSVKKTGSENSSDAYFLMFCEKLKPVVGEKVQTGEDFSAQDISKAMLNHLQDVPVSVTVRLVHAMFNFQEIMSLEVDDILLLDKNVNEPAELIVEGQTFFRGRPAKSNGKHAVVITELCNTK